MTRDGLTTAFETTGLHSCGAVLNVSSRAS